MQPRRCVRVLASPVERLVFDQRQRFRSTGRALYQRCFGDRLPRREFFERQRVEPDRTLAARAGRDSELDCPESRQRLVTRRAPGETEVAGLIGDRLPLGRKGEFALIDPPDVPAGRVDEFELQVVGRSVAAEGECEPVVFRQRAIERSPHHAESAAAFEIEIESHSAAGFVLRGGDACLHAVGRDHRPGGEVVQVIDGGWLGTSRRDGDENRREGDEWRIARPAAEKVDQ